MFSNESEFSLYNFINRMCVVEIMTNCNILDEIMTEKFS